MKLRIVVAGSHIYSQALKPFCWKNNDRTEEGSLLTQFGGIQYTKQWYSHTFYYQIETIYIDIIKCILQSPKNLINIRLFNTYSRFIVLLDS
jgi:hypothetical protein